MKRTGFTIVELLVTMVIFTLILVTVYSTFYMGMKVWRRGEDKKELQKIRLGLLKIDKELNRSFFFSEIPFKGTSQEMTFPLAVFNAASGEIYVVSYVVGRDDTSGLVELIRKEKIFAGLEEEEGKVKKILPPLKSIRFEYGYKTQDASNAFEWQESWDGEEQHRFPLGVRISLETIDEAEHYNKIIFNQYGELGIK